MLPAPPALEQFQVGSDMRVHGMPLRIRGYVVRSSLDEARDWYRRNVPGTLVEDRIGRKLVLGQRQGSYYLTAELEAIPGPPPASYTKILVSTMQSGPQTPATKIAPALQNWARRLPPQTQILQELSDREAGKHLLHLSAVNRQALDTNEHHLTRELTHLGLRLQARHLQDSARQRSLLFSGADREATLVLGRTPDGYSSLVLNLFIQEKD